MKYGIETLRQTFKVLFNNRHSCGWGYRGSELTRKQYRRCQNERAQELREIKDCIRALINLEG